MPVEHLIDGGHAMTGLACPLSSQCTAVDRSGRQVTFNPTSPGTPTPTTIDSDINGMTGVACPSSSQCTAVDGSGRQVTFNPTSPRTPTPTVIDTGSSPFAVACPSSSQCTAVDGSGRQVTFNPTSPGTPTPTVIPGANSLNAVACSSAALCVAVDQAGNGFVGNTPASNPSPPPSPPVSPPSPPFPPVKATKPSALGLNAPSAAQIKAGLVREITPRGKAAKIGALLQKRGCLLPFEALSAGRVVIGWYYLPQGAHLASGKLKTKPMLFAAGNATFSQAGTLTITIKLTANGRRLIKHAKRLTLTAQGTFSPAAQPAVVATRKFILTR